MTDFNIRVLLDPSNAVSGSNQVRGALSGTETQANAVGAALTRAFGAVAIGAAIASATREALSFNTGLAEIATLSDFTATELERLEQATLAQAAAFGSTPSTQTAAAYQIISAGITDTTDTIELLNQANQLAVAGLSEVDTTARVLSATLNVYSDAGLTAQQASDALFTAVQGGQTTINELSSGLGVITPIAEGAGVSFQELTSALSAVTAGGVPTAQALTSVRATLAAVIAPSDEALRTAEDLGIAFNVAAIEANGLEGFLRNVAEATEGNVETLQMLFPQVESLPAVLNLTGGQLDTFADILDRTNESTGATAEAFGIIAGTPAQQLNMLTSTLTTTFVSFANILLEAAVPALMALNAIVSVVSENIDLISVVIGVRLAQAAIPAAITGLTTLVASLTTLVASLTTSSVAVAGLGTVAVTTTGNLGILGTAATVAGGLAARAFALIGGPIGIAVIAIFGLINAIGNYRDTLETIESASENFNQTLMESEMFIDELTGRLNDFSGAAAALDDGLEIDGVDQVEEAAREVDGLTGSLLMLAEARRIDALDDINEQIETLQNEASGTIESLGDEFEGLSGGITATASLFVGLFGGEGAVAQGMNAAQQIVADTNSEIEELLALAADIENTTLDNFVSEVDEVNTSLTGGAEAAETAADFIQQLQNEVTALNQPTELAADQFRALVSAGLDPVQDAGTETAATINSLVAELNSIDAASRAAEDAADDLANTLQSQNSLIESLTGDIALFNFERGTERDLAEALTSVGLDLNDTMNSQVQIISGLFTERARLNAEEQTALELQEMLQDASNDLNSSLQEQLSMLELEAVQLNNINPSRQEQLNLLQQEQALRLIASGLTETQANAIVSENTALSEQVIMQNASNELLARRNELLQNIQTPSQACAQELAELNELFAEGVINPEMLSDGILNSGLALAVEDLENELFGVFGQGLQNQLELVQEQQNERLAIVQLAREQELLTETEFNNAITAINAQAAADRANAQIGSFGLILNSGQQTFSNLLNVAETFAGQQSGIFRGIFAATQAFALANAVVTGGQAIISGFATQPFFPAGLAAGALATAMVGSQIATIVGQSAAGFRDGTDFVTGAGSSISDGVLAMLSVGEGVVTAEANRANPGVVAALNDGAVFGEGGTGGGSPIMITMNISTPDVDSFNNSQRQITADLKRELELAEVA